ADDGERHAEGRRGWARNRSGGEDQDVADEAEHGHGYAGHLGVLRALDRLAAAGRAEDRGTRVAGVDEGGGDARAHERQHGDRRPQSGGPHRAVIWSSSAPKPAGPSWSAVEIGIGASVAAEPPARNVGVRSAEPIACAATLAEFRICAFV